MDVENHEILFSFDQPAKVLPSLLTTVQQTLAQQKTRSGKSVPLYEAHRVLIIDAQQERANYLVQVLSLAGYRSFSVPHSLAAFTFFLQGSFIPLLVILGQDDPAKRFFLQRLVQQMVQKFDVELPVVRLITHVSASPPSLHGMNFMPLLQNPPTPVPPHASIEALVPPSLPQQTFVSRSDEFAGVSTIPLKNPPSSDSFSQSLQPIQQSSPLHPLPPPKKQTKISLEGQSLGRYQIEACIGNGPLGDVYRVYDRLRENRVALKAMQTDVVPSFSNDVSLEEEHIFQRESALMARLKHEHIAPVLNTGKTYISGSSFLYKTMPFYSEGSLTQWLYEHNGNKARAPREMLPLIMQLADALQYSHDQQVLFQSFKPGNILVKEPAKSIQTIALVLTDFSVGFDVLSLPSATMDTFLYLAPERWEGHALPASDQYALAAFAYELLTGRSVFQGNTEQIMKRLHLAMQPQPPSLFNTSLSTQASNVILRALAKRPEERFASVGLFAQNLQRFCS